MIKKNLLSALVAVSVLVFGVGCGKGPEPTGGEDAKSSLERLTTAAPDADLKATVRGLNELSISLHKRSSKVSENYVASPTSFTTALGMASAGAANDTLDAFRTTLRISLKQDAFHGAMNTLDRELTSRGKGAQGTNGKPFALKIVNQTFAQKGFHLESTYLDLLAQQYGSGVKLLDFAEKPEPSRAAINDFVSYHTDALIPELLGQGTITSLTRVVLANAVYFNAGWQKTFDKNATSAGSFTLESGAQVSVDMMRDAEHPSRAATTSSGIELIDLAYEKDEVAMLLVVPPAGQFAAVESALDVPTLEGWLAQVKPEELSLSMPKFNIDSRTNMVEPLSAEGLKVAFTGEADFSGMTGNRDLFITGVLHQSVIKVSEAGTEAAGATAVVFGRDSASAARAVAVDRPFLFFIHDRATGAVLFMGHVVDPR